MTTPTNPTAPVYEQPGDYPKMMYRFDGQFPDEDALKAGLMPGGGVRTVAVSDSAQEADAVANGWTDTPMDFIGSPEVPKRGRKAKSEEPAE